MNLVGGDLPDLVACFKKAFTGDNLTWLLAGDVLKDEDFSIVLIDFTGVLTGDFNSVLIGDFTGVLVDFTGILLGDFTGVLRDFTGVLRDFTGVLTIRLGVPCTDTLAVLPSLSGEITTPEKSSPPDSITAPDGPAKGSSPSYVNILADLRPGP